MSSALSTASAVNGSIPATPSGYSLLAVALRVTLECPTGCSLNSLIQIPLHRNGGIFKESVHEGFRAAWRSQQFNENRRRDYQTSPLESCFQGVLSRRAYRWIAVTRRDDNVRVNRGCHSPRRPRSQALMFLRQMRFPHCRCRDTWKTCFLSSRRAREHPGRHSRTRDGLPLERRERDVLRAAR